MNKFSIQNTIKNTPHLLKFAPWLLLSCVFLVVTTLLVFDFETKRKETATTIFLTKEKGASLIHSFEAALLTAQRWNNEHIRNILIEIAHREDLPFLAIVNQQGDAVISNLPEIEGKNIIPPKLDTVKPSPYVNSDTVKISFTDPNGDTKYKRFYLVEKELFVVRNVRREHDISSMLSIPQEQDSYRDRDERDSYRERDEREQRSKQNQRRNEKHEHIRRMAQEFSHGEVFSMVIAFDMKEILKAKATDDSRDAIYNAFYVSLIVLGGLCFFILIAYQRSYTDIQKSKAYIESLMDALPLGIITLDDKQNILSINPNAEQLTKASHLNSQGKHISEIIPQLHPQDLEAGVRNLSLTLHQIDQNPIQVEINTFPIPTQKNDGYGIILQDLREIQILQEEIHRQERLASIGKLAAGIAHEIRNPLGAVKGLARFFAESAEKDSEEARLAKVMTDEVMRVDKVVSDLLELSKPNTMNINKVNLNDLIEKAKNTVLLQSDTSITFNQEIDAQCETVYLDEDRMIQVLQNIFLNSAQAMPKQAGQIVITAHSIQNEQSISANDQDSMQNIQENNEGTQTHQRFHNNILEIAIKDNGKGIKADQLKNIFTPYYTDKAKGTGLGLVMVQKIVQSHNGTIKVESQEDHGTTIIIRIPQ